MTTDDAIGSGCLAGFIAGLVAFGLALVCHVGFGAAVGWWILGSIGTAAAVIGVWILRG